LTIRAAPFVVHEAFEITWCTARSYVSVLTPSTIVESMPLPGGEMSTFAAPAVRCAAAAARVRNTPVDSMTTSTSVARQASSAGPLIALTAILRPATAIASPRSSTVLRSGPKVLS
jgi:hypothetical protein